MIWNAAAQEPFKIIGENDLIAVDAKITNIPYKYKKLVNAFGMLSMGCTGTHIGRGYVLTAGHCFWAGEEPTQDLACEDTTIDWGVRTGILPYLKSTCQKIIITQKSMKSDFAIIKVFPVPETFVQIELLRKAAPRDVVTIFSHPEWLSLRWSKACIVEFKLDPTLPPDFMQHECDTNPVSSGASIIDTQTLKIVGVHGGGFLHSPGFGINYATYITNIEIINTLKKLGF